MGMVVSIAAFVEDDAIKQSVIESDFIRRMALDICYNHIAIPGDTPLAERNKIYDKVVEEIKNKINNSGVNAENDVK